MFEFFFTFYNVFEDIIREFLLEIKSEIAGDDSVQLKMPVLVNLVTSFLWDNGFPDTYKTANVTPLPKKGSPESLI